MEFETANTTFSFAAPELAYQNKNFQFLTIVIDLLQQTSFNVTPFIDNIPQNPIQFLVGGTAVGLDSFQLDTHALAASGTITVRKRLEGSGRHFRLQFLNNLIDDELRISEFHVSFGIGDEKARGDA
jgi:hypothetical protein